MFSGEAVGTGEDEAGGAADGEGETVAPGCAEPPAPTLMVTADGYGELCVP